MKIGILSDTHDNLPRIREAVETLNAIGVEFVVHCGDFIAPFSLNPFSVLRCDYRGVFGNNDGERPGLRKAYGGKIGADTAELELGGKKIFLCHHRNDLPALAGSGKFDLICFGHTHQALVEKHGATLVLNPGECGGWLYGTSTFATVNLENMEAEIISLP